MARIFLQTLVAFCLLRTVCKASNGDLTASCALPTFSGKELAFTGKISTLFRQSHGHITALVHVRNIYRRDGQLNRFAVINAVDRAASCRGYQHKQGDTRLWVAKRHSSGMLTAIASLPVTMHMVDEILQALPGNNVLANNSAICGLCDFRDDPHGRPYTIPTSSANCMHIT